jgi:hypothetical protein
VIGNPSTTRAVRLLDELVGTVGLDATDAHRAAFVAFAMSKGWTKARIGRYLGISRARVGQKVDKLEDYAATKDVPTLKRVMAVADTVRSERRETDDLVEYGPSDWEDQDFARRLVEMVA